MCPSNAPAPHSHVNITVNDQHRMTLTYRGHGVFDESYGIFLLFLLTTTMGFLALGYIFGSFRAIWSELVGVVFLLLITYLSFFAKYTATINIDTRRDEILFTQKELLR